MGNCSPTSRLLFIALWCYSDDEGRCVDNAKVLRAFAFPLDDAILSTDVEAMLQELHAARLLVRYEVEGRKYLSISNFNEHQHPKKKLRSKLPPPPVGNEFPTSAPLVPPVVVVGVGVGEGVGGEKLQGCGGANAPPPVLRKERRSVARAAPEPQFPGFPRAVCDAAHTLWQGKAGAVPYARFRKAFGPLMASPEAARPPKYPRDTELVPAIDLYLAAVKGTPEARFRSPERCAERLSELAAILRTYPDHPLAQLDAAQRLLGIRGAA